ncbi:MAG: heavy-metal-associated domain-containing protein [Prevotellaceae bacterium]|jgi:copper chaperone CopZ|nr:heavy-metal-associated domain-containing protein [Prevotellaceae bacterium]
MRTKVLFLSIALIISVLAINAQNKKSDSNAKPSSKTEVTYFIPNMHGEHCQSIIEKEIGYEKGVKDLKFDLKAQKLTVVFDDGKTTADKLKAALEKIGYEVKTPSAAASCPKEKQAKSCCSKHH